MRHFPVLSLLFRVFFPDSVGAQTQWNESLKQLQVPLSWRKALMPYLTLLFADSRYCVSKKINSVSALCPLISGERDFHSGYDLLHSKDNGDGRQARTSEFKWQNLPCLLYWSPSKLCNL